MMKKKMLIRAVMSKKNLDKKTMMMKTTYK